MKTAGELDGVGRVADPVDAAHPVPDVEVSPEVSHDASTRGRVARSILEHGPSTAAELAERLSLTPAAVRRHLAVLLESGHLVARERRVYGARGRGRPAKVFALTDTGRQGFYQAYDRLAVQALHFVRRAGGDAAVEAFAESLWRDLAREFHAEAAARAHADGGQPTGRTPATAPADAGSSPLAEAPDAGSAVDGPERPTVLRPADPGSPEQVALEGRVRTLVDVLNRQGFVASLHPVLTGQQVCQYHCPVAHVAREFPELCVAETKVFAELLGSHVQRIATIAHADGVCTTHIPHPVNRKVSR